METVLRKECRKSKPHFFKIMIGRFTTRLRIPPAFVKHIDVSSRYAILKGPSNNTWHVEIKQDCGLIFHKGWRVFCRDHHLELGDFLVFKYDGNMQFSVQVFDRTACEKEDAFHVDVGKGYSSDEECQVEVFDNTQAKGFATVPNHASKHKKKRDQRQIEEKHSTDGKSPPSNDASNPKKIRDYNQFAEQNTDGPNGCAKGGSPAKFRSQSAVVSQRRAVTLEDRHKALQAALSFQSDRPYCAVVMKPYYVYYGFFLSLPCNFRQRHFLEANFNLNLVDPSGESWPVHFVSISNGTTGGLCGGWGAFSFGNNIEEGDVCIFELTKQDEMRVHIFRVVQEIVPLLVEQRKNTVRATNRSDLV